MYSLEILKGFSTLDNHGVGFGPEAVENRYALRRGVATTRGRQGRAISVTVWALFRTRSTSLMQCTRCTTHLDLDSRERHGLP